MQSFKPAYSGEHSKQPTNFITSSDYSVANRYLVRVAVIYTFDGNLPNWDYQYAHRVEGQHVGCRKLLQSMAFLQLPVWEGSRCETTWKEGGSRTLLIR